MLMNARQRIDRTRYPNFAALARTTATWYRNATTVGRFDHGRGAGDCCHQGVRARTRCRLPRDYPNSIFTLLGNSHSMHVQETVTEVCPMRLCGGRQARRSRGAPELARVRPRVVVSLHLLVPEGHAGGTFPAVDRAFGDFRDGGSLTMPRRSRDEEQRFAFTEARASSVDALLRGHPARGQATDLPLSARGLPASAVAVPAVGPGVPLAGAGRPRARRREVVTVAVSVAARDAAPPAPGGLHRPCGREDRQAIAPDGPLRPLSDRVHRRPRGQLPSRTVAPERRARNRQRHRGGAAVHQVPGTAPQARR